MTRSPRTPSPADLAWRTAVVSRPAARAVGRVVSGVRGAASRAADRAAALAVPDMDLTAEFADDVVVDTIA